MAKTPRPWTVTPHDPIRELEENLWDVEGDVAGMGAFRRRMTIAKRSDGRLVFFNAMPMDEAAMKKIEAWGEPGFLVVPNTGHRGDIHAFKERYKSRGLKLLTPELSKRKVSEVAEVDGVLADMPADPDVGLEDLQGTKTGEAVMTVRSKSRTTIVFADAFFNMPRGNFMAKLTGLTGGPKVTPIFRFFFMADTKAYAQHLMRLTETPKLERLIVTHGDIVESGGPAVLRKIAESA